ncbi:MAG: SUMF1/EgtB/PvdO family nonheme iron enzyme [Firmicutes bacterium]|nr:SUMF1/EgtB/PvdO family nonheme iron enzyme [Bacillota bacterium]
MREEPKSRFGPEVLLIFLGHSSDANEEAQAVLELEGELRRDLEVILTAMNHQCRFSTVRIWEWNEDASPNVGGQEKVISPEIKRANMAVFVFKDRIGAVTWEEMQQCRERQIPIIAAFPKMPSNLERLMDIDYIKNWLNLLEKKKELSANWTNPEEKSVLPQKEYSSIQDLLSIVNTKIKQSMAEILRDASGLEATGIEKRTLTGKQSNQPLPIPPEYRDWVREFHSTVSFDQLAKKGEAVPVQLIEIYIPLETNNPFYKPEQEKLAGEKRKKGELQIPDEVAAVAEKQGKEPAAIDIEELLGRVECILLRGNAGMGKSTLVKHLANTITHGATPPIFKDYLPVMVLLKDLWLIYNEALNQSCKKKLTFEELLEAYLEKSRCPLSMEVIGNYLVRNKALFLFDGLDEVPEGLRDGLATLIAEFRFKNKENRFLLTGRPHGISGKVIECFGKFLHDIHPLDQPKIEEFIRKWFRVVSGQATGLANVTAEDMVADTRHHEYIATFTQNPLLLAAVCVLYQARKRIPEQRADLYNRIVENLLWRRFHDPARPDLENQVALYLMSLAFSLQVKNRKTVEEDEARQVLREVFPKESNEGEQSYLLRINRLFQEIEPCCGLLNRLSSGEIEFSHLTFQEFLAAKHMEKMDLDYRRYLGKEWWEETLILHIGYINLKSKIRSNAMVEGIFKAESGSEREKIHLWLLGAKTLRDFQASQREETTVSLVRGKLLDIIGSGAGVKERFEAGEILGSLGDPRLDEDNMILVKGGVFIRGSQDKGDHWNNAKPVKEIELDDFWIGKYPVTNQEFKRFVDAGGYLTEKWWSSEGWQWRIEEKISDPEYWHDRKWNGPNFPVVGISWYEATAYANWLSEQTGQSYRLPTEAEWEKPPGGPMAGSILGAIHGRKSIVIRGKMI